MTGPEHYREAERLIATLPEDKPAGGLSYEDMAMFHRCAQVHATLALAAATADALVPSMQMQPWTKVIR